MEPETHIIHQSATTNHELAGADRFLAITWFALAGFASFSVSMSLLQFVIWPVWMMGMYGLRRMFRHDPKLHLAFWRYLQYKQDWYAAKSALYAPPQKLPDNWM